MKKLTTALMTCTLCMVSMLCFNSCNNEPDMAITPISGDLHYGDTIILSVTGAPADAQVTYAISDEYTALLSNDTLIAWHIGEATITATAGGKTATLNITVTPLYTMAAEPLMEWNISLDTLKARKGEPAQSYVKDGTGSVIYQQAQSLYEIYSFRKDALVASGLQVQNLTKEVYSSYISFLLERYVYVQVQGGNDNAYYFVNALSAEDVTIMIEASLGQQNQAYYLTIQYAPYTVSSNSAPAFAPIKHQMFQ